MTSKSISNPLVERLRDRNRIAGEGMFYAIPMLAEAATEIERLERELKIQQGVNDLAYIPHRHLAEQNDSLRARLAALENSTPETPARLPPLDDAMRLILGRPNFMCRDIARMLERRRGVPMKRASEIEQAETIYFLLGMYLEHGPERWAWEADKYLNGDSPPPPSQTTGAPQHD